MEFVSYLDMWSDVTAKSLGMLGSQKDGGGSDTARNADSWLRKTLRTILFCVFFPSRMAGHILTFLSYSKVALMETNCKVQNYYYYYYYYCYLLTYLLNCPLTYLFIYLLTYSLAYLPNYLLNYLLTHLLTHSLTSLLSYLLTCLLT